MQKTADEMRISDWSSDVCSSDLVRSARGVVVGELQELRAVARERPLEGVIEEDPVVLAVERERDPIERGALGELARTHRDRLPVQPGQEGLDGLLALGGGLAEIKVDLLAALLDVRRQRGLEATGLLEVGLGIVQGEVDRTVEDKASGRLGEQIGIDRKSTRLNSSQ